MSLDIEVENAVFATVNEFGQPEKVAKRLISWLKDLSERDLNGVEDNEHFDILKSSIELGDTGGN